MEKLSNQDTCIESTYEPALKKVKIPKRINTPIDSKYISDNQYGVNGYVFGKDVENLKNYLHSMYR